ncbi:hypothetical protein SmJEL517_g01385 [Synchytrium microbalum]|uniref:RNA polymerase II elongation factor ELL N-terminal domain-containing protein n=1 Tax=Synchytrium microbalum TaxID=1806994 RepID=A0A507CFI0_9FUNG|nr:uncharacterized protein SmJEL517_g01385 [Synchytrium microbalum]TPX36684.1 hypothetical protein SmJEL517_g01385 [Synchytrium microbalum]
MALSEGHYDITIPNDSHSRRIIHLRLSEDVLKQLQDDDSVELSFDFQPSNQTYHLIVNDEGHELTTSQAQNFTECYKQVQPNKLEFVGSVSHLMHVKSQFNDKLRSEIRQKQIAAEEQKHSRKIELTDMVPDANKKRKKTAMTRAVSKERSPAITPSPISRSVSLPPPATSTTTVSSSSSTSKKDDDLRKRMIEILALVPMTLDKLVKRLTASEAKVRQELKDVAEYNRGAYELKDAAYRDVDPYHCRWYDRKERETVIRNAKKAFQALRLPDHAPEWKRLSPPPPPPQREQQREQSLSVPNMSKTSSNLSTTANADEYHSDSGTRRSSNNYKREGTPDTLDRRAKRVKTSSSNTKKKDAVASLKTMFDNPPRNLSVAPESPSSNAASSGGKSPVVADNHVSDNVASSSSSNSSKPQSSTTKAVASPVIPQRVVKPTATSSSIAAKTVVSQAAIRLEPVKPLSTSLDKLSDSEIERLFDSRWTSHETLYSEICNLAQTAQRMHEKMVAANNSSNSNGHIQNSKISSGPASANNSAHSELCREIDTQISQFTVDGHSVTFNQDELRSLLSGAVTKYEVLRSQVSQLKAEVERRQQA